MPGRPALQDMLTRLFTSRSASSPRCGAVAAAAVGGGSGCPPPWTERARPPPRRAPRAAHPAAWLHPDCHAEAVGTELRLRQTSSGATTGKAKSVSSSGMVGGGRSPRGDLLAVATARGTHENAVRGRVCRASPAAPGAGATGSSNTVACALRSGTPFKPFPKRDAHGSTRGPRSRLWPSAEGASSVLTAGCGPRGSSPRPPAASLRTARRCRVGGSAPRSAAGCDRTRATHGPGAWGTGRLPSECFLVSSCRPPPPTPPQAPSLPCPRLPTQPRTSRPNASPHWLEQGVPGTPTAARRPALRLRGGTLS